MNKNGKYFLIVILSLFLIPFSVVAKEKATLNVDKVNLKEKESVTVMVDLDYDDSLYAFTAGLKYDENVFEVLEMDNFQEKDEWSDISYNEENNKFALLNKKGQNSEHLLMIKLFVKDNPTSGKTTITLDNPVASNGNSDIEFNNASKTLTIENSTGEKNNSYSKKQTISEKNNKVKTNRPFIIGSAILIFLLIFSLALINTTFLSNALFIKNNKKKITIIFSVLIAILLAIIITLNFMNNNKGDVNNDGKKDYVDAQKINEYLIDIVNESEEEQKIADPRTDTKLLTKVDYKKALDVNNDGKITITDSAQQTQNTTDKTDYSVKLQKKKINSYYHKKDDVELKFTAKINYSDVRIKEVFVNNQKIETIYNEDIYTVNVKAPNKAGLKQYVITKVILDNGKQISIDDLTFTIDVLKEEPEIKEFNFSNNNISLTVNDLDKALQNARIKVIKGQVDIEDFIDDEADDFETREVVLDETLDINSKNISFKTAFDLGETYSVLILGDYDLDTNTLDSKSNYHKNKNLYFDTFTSAKALITPLTDLASLYPEQGQAINFDFKVDVKPNNMSQVISKIGIDDYEYEVIYLNDHYSILLNSFSNSGEKKLKINYVILDDGTKILCNDEIIFEVLKQKPQFSNFIYHDKENKITFSLDDKDKAVQEAKIVITKQDDTLIFEKDLDLTKKDFEYKVELEKGNKYNIKIVGSYDLDFDNANKKNDFTGSLFNHELTVHDVVLSHYDKEIYYAEKSQDVELKFNAKIIPEDNGSVITEVVVNNKIYYPNYYGNGTYGISIKAPSNTGLKEYMISKVTLGDDEVSKKLSFKVDVLKDKPTIEDFFIDETESVPVIIFNLKDNDNALKANLGEVIIKDGEKELKRISLKKGLNEIKLKEFAEELKEADNYLIDVKVNYDLDSDKDNGKNENSEYLIKNHAIKIYKAKLTLAENNKYYFNKNEMAEISIKASINSDDTVTIKSFVMDDNSIVEALNNNGIYNIKVKTSDKAGKDTYKISSIILSDDVVIKAPLEFSINVLKDVPYINKVNFNDDNKSLSYELVDIDNAFLEGTISIYDKDSKELKSEIIKSRGTIKYDFIDGETYLVKVIGNYNLDSEKGDSQNYQEEMYAHSFVVGGSYNFKISDISITDKLQKGEKPVIRFTSINDRGAKVVKVVLNGKEYDVSNIAENNYEVILNDVNTELGRHSITFDGVKLDTLKYFENNKDYTATTLTYTVLKQAPSVTDINLSYNRNDKNVNVKFKLQNDNLALTELTAVLVDSSDRILDSKKLTLEEIYQLAENTGINLSYDKNTDGRYCVKFLASYELADQYRYNNINIGEASLFIENGQIYVDTITLKNSKYVTKKEKNYEISYDVFVGENIKTNNGKKYTRLSAITTNGKNYIANGESTNRPNIYKSKIAITAPNESGVLTLTTDRVQLELNSYYDKVNNYYSVPGKTIQIEVLKSAPQIENLKISQENYKEKTALLDFDVKLDDKAVAHDESFINGYVEFNGKKYNVNRGHNTIKLEDIVLDTNFDLIFKASYDLDTDVLNENNIDENEYTDEIIYQTKYGLFDSNKYKNITINDGKAISINNDNYFEKNESIKVMVDISADLEELGLTLDKVVIKGREYLLTKIDNNYEFVYDGYKTSGEKEISITAIILSNGKVVELPKAYTVKLEVLKDRPQIVNYNYEIKDNKIVITSELKDTDGSIIGKPKIKITTENSKEIVNEDYKNEISIAKSNFTRCYLEVIGTYDRDTDIKDTKNSFKDIKLLEEVISLEKNYIELKDIDEINLYKSKMNDGLEEVILVNEISKAELISNKKDYFVEINMSQMPSIRAKIKEVSEENGHLILVLDYKYVTDENSNAKNLEIDFGEIKGGIASNETHPDIAFKTLITKLQNNEDVTLTKNYDASSISTDTNISYVDFYSGKLNGNGYTIKNLEKPLFNKIKNATIENVKFTDVTMPATSGNGSIAIEAEQSTLKNVYITNYYKANNESRVGTLLGNAKQTTISNCNAVNFNIDAGWANLQQIGGLVGYAEDTIIKNSYVIGKIPGGWNFRAGLVGRAFNSTFENNYVKVDIGYGMGNNLVYDLTFGDNNIFKNNISLTTGFTHRFYSSAKESVNNYYVDSSEAEDINQQGVIKITKEAVNKELFKEAKFSEEIWSLKNISYDKTPIFKNEEMADLIGSENENFDEKKITLYNNLRKLMPYYKIDTIINMAKNINDNDLNNKEISHIVPINSKGNIVTYLTKKDLKKISKIKVVYKNNEHREYNVTYDNVYDFVASYRIPDLKIDYNYKNYIIDDNSQVINDLTNYLKSLDYTENLDILTSTEDSRIYKDFYNETTKKELKEFVLKFLSNSNFANTSNDESINNYLENAVKQEKRLEKTLYVYNYFRRFYDLDVAGMKLYDFMLFNMDGFDQILTPTKVADLYLANGNNFNTASTGSKYAEILGSYTKQETIAKFLEYMVTEFGNGDLNKWTREQFKGYLVEIPIEGMEDKIQYTLWDHFSNEDANYKPHRAYDMMLPILTLPEKSAYIISTPVQYVIGAQRSYIEDPNDSSQQDILRRRIKSYADRMQSYFNTAYKVLDDVKIFNDIHTFHLDKRFAYDENGAMVYQQVGTEEPFHKNFNEVTGRWQTSDGNAAVAWGDRIDWSAEGLLDGYIDADLAHELGKPVQEYTYHTFTHETAHNIDARLFLKNNGRRFDAGGEDYADSNLTQAFGPNDIIMNFSVNFNKGDRIGSSLSPSRINTPEKIKDYYDKVFQTIYVMDYIEAQAFLQLSSEDKAEIGIQITYPNELKYQEDGNKYRARQTTGFNQRSVADWDSMQLNSIDDLIDNKIMKYAGVYQYASRGSNSYGGEGINTAHWYQPSNPDGRPDSYALKWLAYEMLGYKGYQDGYIEYYSNIHSEKKTIYKNIDKPEEGNTEVNYKTDNMAIEKITNGAYTNIDDYKKARFKETGEKLKYLKAINVKEYVQKLYDALVKDAKSTRIDLADKMAKNPNCLSDYWCRVDVSNRRSYPESTKVRQEIYYTLKDLTDDFVDEIYANSVQQEIDFKVTKEATTSVKTANINTEQEIKTNIIEYEEKLVTNENEDKEIETEDKILEDVSKEEMVQEDTVIQENELNKESEEDETISNKDSEKAKTDEQEIVPSEKVDDTLQEKDTSDGEPKEKSLEESENISKEKSLNITSLLAYCKSFKMFNVFSKVFKKFIPFDNLQSILKIFANGHKLYFKLLI